jgi:hypothetical protein
MASRLKHRSAASVVSFLGGILLALLLFDSGLRLVEATPLWQILPVIEPIPGQPDREFGFDATPGAEGIWSKEHRSRIRVNSLGLRDVERDLVKPAGTIRVGLLGDSMVEAMQVNQEATFGALAERRLRSESYKIELINLAIAGPSPLRQLLRLEKRGYALNLDLVLANSASSSFWSGALRDDSQNPGYVEADDGRLVRGYAFRQRFSQRHADDLWGRSFVTLYQHSPLLRMLYLRGREPPQLLRITATQTASPSIVAGAAPDPAALCRAAATALEPHIELWMHHQPAREWAATAQFLDEFSQSTAAHGVKVLYAVRDIPLSPSNCSSVDARRAELISVMEAEFTRRGMIFVDWSARVAAAAGRRDLEPLHGFGVHRGGGHLNYDGHRAWATALMDLLKTELPRLHGDSRPAL